MKSDNSENNQNNASEELFSEGYQKAIDLLKGSITEEGFLATNTDLNNYRRIWGRDGCITGLAALLTGKDRLIDGCRRTLETLIKYQGPHGEIPSNVDPQTERVSYGGMVGRVDSNLWFIICCGKYWETTGDEKFLSTNLAAIEKVRFLLGAWEINNRGLLYVPQTGDWADEYIHNGYVLYDQVLYLQALREFCKLHRHIHNSADHQLDDGISRLKHLIQSNYWFSGEEDTPDDVYHEVLYEKGRRMAHRCADRYWAPFFSPVGYGYRFDTLANVLVSLLKVADSQQTGKVDEYIDSEVADKDVMLLPAFHPVITPRDEDWEDLQMTFSYTFRNKPYEFQNGGLWPMVTGFYVADLAARGKKELAERYLDGIYKANSQEVNGQSWSFPEFLHGKKHTPGGTPGLDWNAATAIIARESLRENFLF
jgi:hypothetical protein